MKAEEIRAAREFNDKSKDIRSEKELRVALVACAMRPALVFAREMIRLHWGADRIDSSVRDFVGSTLAWAGLPADADLQASAEWRQYQDELLEAVQSQVTESELPSALQGPAEDATVAPPPAALADNVQPENAPDSQFDPVATARTALLTEFKARGRDSGIRVTDKMVAKAANPNWNDRTMVAWWKRNDKRSTAGHDKRIKELLERHPTKIWPKP